ncbi:hypothetical protein HFD88_004295 [Aspergillus terreus]|nr:hypothetical protein HFD88_004295 [Aspergillus terreus]
MVVFNLSYTAPINRPGSPALTQDQIWKCVDLKVRHAEKFVPAIVRTELLSESAGELTRRITFAPGGHPSGKTDAVETCRLFAPTRVDFIAADGSTIINAVSVGVDGNYYYTYIFEWRHPEIAEGSMKEAEAQRSADWETTKLAVEATIETMHRLVKEGVVN